MVGLKLISDCLHGKDRNNLQLSRRKEIVMNRYKNSVVKGYVDGLPYGDNYFELSLARHNKTPQPRSRELIQEFVRDYRRKRDNPEHSNGKVT